MMTSNDTSGTSTPFMAKCDRWPALESDAEVFTALLHTLLSPSSTPSDTHSPSCPFFFQDVFSLDDDCLGFVQGETLALILAYDDRALNPSQESPPDPQLPIAPIFIKQPPILDNACGTIALLHAIINTLPASTIPSSSLLAKFVSPIQAGETSFTSESLGIRLDAHEGIRAAHCEHAAQGQSEQVQGDAVRYHFICLIPNPLSPYPSVLELDGLKAHPIIHVGGSENGKKGETFLQMGAMVLKRDFLAQFSNADETEINVLALVSVDP